MPVYPGAFHDWGEINGVLYIDMRLVDGSDLHAVLRRDGPLEPASAASIIAQVAEALDAAHAAGLIHRDVKPENVLLTSSNFAYLVDFGIAHLGGESGITSAGSAIGSFAYMAPERFTGGQLGPQADVYSLACVLYECLTGQPPFPPGDVTQMMASHLMRPPPRPSAVRPELNPAFDLVIARGMEKRPELRFTSAGELARAATDAASTRPPTTRPFPQQWPNPEATGYTPYRDHPRAPETPAARRGLGPVQTTLAVAAVAVLGAVLIGALWLIIGKIRARTSGSLPLTPRRRRCSNERRPPGRRQRRHPQPPACPARTPRASSATRGRAATQETKPRHWLAPRNPCSSSAGPQRQATTTAASA